ncbi:TPA: head maturation protease, ClpP-related [Clostridioides difficile]
MSKKNKDNLTSILQIKNSTDKKAELYFYGDIVSSSWGAWEEEDQYPESIKNFLKGQEDKDLDIYINSGGGSVFAGMAIYNMLKRHTGFKTIKIDGIAGSIASIIALAGDKIIIPRNAFFMIHKAWGIVQGNSKKVIEYASLLEKIDKTALEIYQENLKNENDIEKIKQMIEEETWLTGEEAAKYFKFELSGEVDAVACSGDILDKYNKTPKVINNIKVNDIEERKNNLLKRIERI